MDLSAALQPGIIPNQKRLNALRSLCCKRGSKRLTGKPQAAAVARSIATLANLTLTRGSEHALGTTVHGRSVCLLIAGGVVRPRSPGQLICHHALKRKVTWQVAGRLSRHPKGASFGCQILEGSIAL